MVLQEMTEIDGVDVTEKTGNLMRKNVGMVFKKLNHFKDYFMREVAYRFACR
jgi:ABC-type phosphate transport system ATPase subunit